MMRWWRNIRRYVAAAVLCLLLAPLAFGGVETAFAAHAGHDAGGVASAPNDHMAMDHGELPCSLVLACDHGHCASMALASPAPSHAWRGDTCQPGPVAVFDGRELRPVPPPPKRFS
jgi:hypothetical protein